MTLSPKSTRVLLTSGAIGALLSLASPGAPTPLLASVFSLAVVAGVLALSTRTGLLLVAARERALAVDAAAPRGHRLLARTAPAAIAGSALGAALALAGDAAGGMRTTLMVGAAAAIGITMGLWLARADRNLPRAPRSTSRGRWLALDTALPAAVLASLVGAAIGLVRFPDLDATVGAGTIARHLGVTTFLYALLVGLGGFFKTYSEQSAGLVAVEKTTWSVPGPIVGGGALGVLFLVAGARFLPDLRAADVVALKAACGFVVGGLVSTLGAIQGARAASLGLKRSL